jgi:hypothetical protein
MIRSALLAVSVVALDGALLFSPVSQQSARAQILGAALKASAADNGNLVTLVHRGGGGRGGHIGRGGGGRAMHAYRGGRAHVSHPIRRHYPGNVGRYHGGNRYDGNRYYGNRYYGYRRGYLPWLGVLALALTTTQHQLRLAVPPQLSSLVSCLPVGRPNGGCNYCAN